MVMGTTYIHKRYEKVCVTCGNQYVTNTDIQVTCSRACRKEYDSARYGRRSAYQGMATGTVGAITEMELSVFFLANGYEVFRSLSPSCTADLVVCKDGRTLRVECRTGYRSPVTGTINYPKKAHGHIDLFAVYIHNGQEILLYEPDAKTPYTQL